MTKQEQVLKSLGKSFGTSAFTEDTLNYKRVGYVQNTKTVSCIGDTWEQAVSRLKKSKQK